jgi:hypothetical protein
MIALKFLPVLAEPFGAVASILAVLRLASGSGAVQFRSGTASGICARSATSQKPAAANRLEKSFIEIITIPLPEDSETITS